MSDLGHPSIASSQGPLSAPLAMQATSTTHAPLTSPCVPTQEVSISPSTVATAPILLVSPIMTLPSTILHLCSVLA